MCKSIPGNQKHLTLDQRIIIEKELDQGKSLRSIALQLEKDPTTISKEIKNIGLFRNIAVLMNRKINVPWLKIARKRISAGALLPFAKECVSSVITVIPIAMTLFRAATTVRNLTRLPLSAMPVARKADADWIKPTIGQPPRIDSIEQSWSNHGPVSIFLRNI